MGRRKRYYVKEDGEASTKTEEMATETRTGKVCNTPMVRVREDPSESGRVIRVLDQGDEVTILGVVENRFYKVQLDKDISGYISCEYCKEV